MPVTPALGTGGKKILSSKSAWVQSETLSQKVLLVLFWAACWEEEVQWE